MKASSGAFLCKTTVSSPLGMPSAAEHHANRKTLYTRVVRGRQAVCAELAALVQNDEGRRADLLPVLLAPLKVCILSCGMGKSN